MTPENYASALPQSSRRLRNPLIGLWCMLVSMGMLFLGLCSVFLFFQLEGQGWPPPGTPRLNLALPTITLVLLLVSSGAMRWGSRAIRRDDVDGLRMGLMVALLMGGLFLANQAYAFVDIGLPIGSGLYIAILYILIIIHGLHLIGGMIFLGITLARAGSGDFSSKRHLGVDACEIFWHFVVWIWAILFPLLYLL